tara:strand:- start:6877 stop:7503 length:627 start_codon:yes stop_codon:yes gene_type:complete
MISILDYGVGNLNAFCTIYKRLNIDVEIVSTAEAVLRSSHIILPGVGAFDTAMDKLNKSGMRDALDKAVYDKKTPILGVCIGMHMLGNSSEEGSEEGLGYIEGDVCSMGSIIVNEDYHLPHMGWNNITSDNENHPIWKDIDSSRGFYFLHSYFFKPKNKSSIFASCNYGNDFTCAIQEENIFGFQFHPEKSLNNGIHLLRNFKETSIA